MCVVVLTSHSLHMFATPFLNSWRFYSQSSVPTLFSETYLASHLLFVLAVVDRHVRSPVRPPSRQHASSRAALLPAERSLLRSHSQLGSFILPHDILLYLCPTLIIPTAYTSHTREHSVNPRWTCTLLPHQLPSDSPLQLPSESRLRTPNWTR